MKEKEYVDVVATGYEWDCPKCSKNIREVEYKEEVTCPRCGITYLTNPPEHAYE